MRKVCYHYTKIKMNILIVEDEIYLAEKIKNIFSNKIISNRIKILHSYTCFLNELSIIESYDIILVDIMLSDYDKKTGIDIVKIIRKKNINIPIIIISSMSDYHRIEWWFDAWANDYIKKPFRIRELEIRVLKWFKTYFLSLYFGNDKTISYNWLMYNIWENQFYYDWELIKLTRKNKYILSILLSKPEKLISNTYLIEKIWWDIYMVIERNLRVSIHRLKAELEKHDCHNRIVNVRWEWYMLKK